MDDFKSKLTNNNSISENLSNDSKIPIEDLIGNMIMNLNQKITEFQNNESILQKKCEKMIDENNLTNSQKLLDLTNSFNSYKQDQEEKFSKMKKESSHNLQLLNQQLKSIKTEKDELKKHVEISLKNLNEKVEEIVNSIKQGDRDSLLKEFDKMKEEITKSNPANDNCIISMPINKISEIKKGKWNYLFSDYFVAKMNPYLMRLKLANSDNGLLIWLLIYPGQSDDDLKWPMEADLTMRIGNRSDPFQCKILRDHCKIERPENNSCSSSQLVKFPHSDMSKSGLMKSILLVECLVKFS